NAVGDKLSTLDMLYIRAFNFKVNTDITVRTYNKLPRAFPELERLPTEHRMHARIAFLSGIQGVRIDCCVNVCVAFTGEYKSLKSCPQCGKECYEHDPQRPGHPCPRKTLQFIPLIPRLINMYCDPEMARKLAYQGNFKSPAGIIRDIFYGALYQRLCGWRVWVGGQKLEHNYFDMPTDVALGLSTDGFGPFKSHKQSC
ncbi:hypothetical protein BDV93DRAFT_428873, partial [Ceratobasidium sp. AG-I]